LEQVSTNRSHGGTQGVYTHQSAETGTPMTFSVFVPDHAPGAKLPVLWYLSGLTCTHANVTEKGEYRAACARGTASSSSRPTPARVAMKCPMTIGYDFGKGAGFYVDARQAPWASQLSACAAISKSNCLRWSPRTFRSTWRGKASPAIRWAGTAR
jgi:S-formylglutathione hydrolase